MRSISLMPLLAIAALVAAPAFAATSDGAVVPRGLEIRFCPGKRVHSWPAADTRELNSLLLQNVAIVNRGSVPAKLESVTIQLLSRNAIVDERHFDAAALERVGRRGDALQKSGMLRAVAFQFCGTDLIANDESLAGSTLAPSQALLIMQQAFLYSGARDTVRVSATVRTHGKPRTIEGTLPVDGVAPAALTFPLRGAWYVGAGATFHTAHRWAVPEEFALDLVRVGADGRTHSGDGTRFTDFHAYGAEVIAAGAGRVVVVHDGEVEDARVMRQPGETAAAYFQRLLADQAARLAKGTDAIAGNYVVVKHGEDAYSLYAHLQPGSLRVRAGDVVAAGQTIGLLGSSGNSTEPHLHFQVCDAPDPLACAGRPMTFTNVTLPLADEPRQLQSGDALIAE